MLNRVYKDETQKLAKFKPKSRCKFEDTRPQEKGKVYMYVRLPNGRTEARRVVNERLDGDDSSE